MGQGLPEISRQPLKATAGPTMVFNANSLSDGHRDPVLVTGGAGFVGSHIAERLLREGRSVCVLDALNSETSTLAEKRDNIQHLESLALSTAGAAFAFERIDLINKEDVVAALRNHRPRVCIHAAALVMDRRSVDSPDEFFQNNCSGTISLLEAIKSTGFVQHVVYISSRSAIGEKTATEAFERLHEQQPLRPINAYGASKAAAEQLCHVYHTLCDLTVSVCRMFPMLGPRGRVDMFPRRLLTAIHDNQPIELYGDGSATRDWLYIDDAVDGILKAAEFCKGFEVFHFGTGVATRLREFIATAEDVTGKQAIKHHIAAKPGDAEHVGLCNYEKAFKCLNWLPEVDLREAIRRTFQSITQRCEETKRPS